jgi:hypothetical protein
VTRQNPCALFPQTTCSLRQVTAWLDLRLREPVWEQRQALGQAGESEVQELPLVEHSLHQVWVRLAAGSLVLRPEQPGAH